MALDLLPCPVASHVRWKLRWKDRLLEEWHVPDELSLYPITQEGVIAKHAKHKKTLIIRASGTFTE